MYSMYDISYWSLINWRSMFVTYNSMSDTSVKYSASTVEKAFLDEMHGICFGFILADIIRC